MSFRAHTVLPGNRQPVTPVAIRSSPES